MNLSEKLFNAFVRSNFFVALCAALLTSETQIVFYKSLPYAKFSLLFQPEPYIVFFGTFCIYNYHRIIRYWRRRNCLELNPKEKFIKRNLRILISASMVSGAISILLIYLFVKIKIFVALFIPTGILSIWYVLRFAKLKIPSLRDLPYLKISVITICWIILVGVFPLWNISEVVFLLTEFWIYLILSALFIFSITLPFDIRDIDFDKQEGVKTIPIKIGAKNTLLLSLFLLLCCLILVVILYRYFSFDKNLALALLISFVFTGMVISKAKQSRPEYFYSFVIEGTMALQFLLVLFASYINTIAN